MRIRDWSSDVCSSDLRNHRQLRPLGGVHAQGAEGRERAFGAARLLHDECEIAQPNDSWAAGQSQRVGIRSAPRPPAAAGTDRSEEHTSELQSPIRISYAVFCLNKKKRTIL